MKKRETMIVDYYGVYRPAGKYDSVIFADREAYRKAGIWVRLYCAAFRLRARLFPKSVSSLVYWQSRKDRRDWAAAARPKGNGASDV